MVGNTLGVRLAQEGLSVLVVERATPAIRMHPEADRRTCALAFSTQQLLARAGAWEAMAPHAEPITDIRVTDGHSPVFLHYDHREVGTVPFGYIVENVVIRAALEDVAVSTSGLRIYAPAEMDRCEIDTDEVRVWLSGGICARAPLLVGADGRSSRVREAAGIALGIQKDYHQTALVCTIAHTRPHHGLAQERFLPQGPFAVLPMPGQRSSLVWVEPTRRAGLFAKLSMEDLADEILQRTGDYLGEITVLDRPELYPLTLRCARDYVVPRVALVGDAAHGIHPIAGQGVNLGFRDVEALVACVAGAHLAGKDSGEISALRVYERARRADGLAMIAVTDGINALFSNRVLPLKIVRDIGLFAVGHMPPVKRFFMRSAMGHKQAN